MKKIAFLLIILVGTAVYILLINNNSIAQDLEVAPDGLPIIKDLGMVFSFQGDAHLAAEVCANCHPDRYKEYIKSPHFNREDPRAPMAKFDCETCHFPGKTGKPHVAAGGGRGIGGVINPAAESPIPVEVKNEVCLQCHARFPLRLPRIMWHGSIHEQKGLACTNCHRIHYDGQDNPKHLKFPTIPQVCFQCHKQIKAQVAKPSHHPIREGKVVCTDCHNPHGAVSDRLLNANRINEKCYQCHAEKRGPFLWEHPPVVEKCINCHTPHGSNHDKLLIAKVPYLCQRCHATDIIPKRCSDCHANNIGGAPNFDLEHPTRQFGIPQDKLHQSIYAHSNNRMFYRSCLNCHNQIHGSNHPSGKFFQR